MPSGAPAPVTPDGTTLLLQKNWTRFPLLRLEANAGDDRRVLPATLLRPPLLLGGKAYCGFRFLAPPGATDFCWAFADLPTTGMWSIAARQGVTQDFQGYLILASSQAVRDRQAWYDPLNRVSSPPIILQALPAHSLQGGQEYLLWFSRPSQSPPARFACTVSFRPTDGSERQMRAGLGVLGAFSPPGPPLFALTPLPPTEAAGKEAPRLLSAAEMRGISVSERTLVPPHDVHGHGDGRTVSAAVILNNYTRYALSQVTLRLLLYGKTPQGKAVVETSLPYTASSLVVLPGEASPVPLPPLGHAWVESGLLDTRLPPDHAEMAGYWMEPVSAVGPPYRASASLPPLERLTISAQTGDTGALEEVVRANPLLAGAGSDAEGNPLLDDPVPGDHAAVAAFLLDHGADVNGGRTASTPLICAVHWGSAGVVDVLLAHHADLTRKDPAGETALDEARAQRLPVPHLPVAAYIVQALEKAQADVGPSPTKAAPLTR